MPPVRRTSVNRSWARLRGGAVAALALVLLLAGCTTSGSASSLPEPRDGRSGLQLSGRIGGKEIAVSDGLPRLLVGGCSVHYGIPAEVCFASRTIDGTPVVIGLANPRALGAAGQLEAGRASCDSTPACAEIEDHALVFVRVGDEIAQADRGTVTLREHVDGSRYAGSLRLRVSGGSVSGSFDVVPRPEPGSG